VAPDHLRLITPLRKNHAQNVAVIAEELNYSGVSVVISRRECIQTATRSKKAEKS
jgi:indolepyruvate ferredoxin oxidoreductase alpha subunit